MNTISDRNDLHLELFETTSRKNQFIPRNLQRMFNKVIGGQFFELVPFLQEHTFFPILKKFSQDSIVEKCIFFCSSECNENVSYITPAISSIVSNEVRYCPRCIEYDDNQFGEAFIHRVHQFAPFPLCLEHNVSLITQCPECSKPLCTNTKQLHSPYCPHCEKHLECESKAADPFLKEIFAIFYTIFLDRSEITAKDILAKLLAALGNKGFIHFKGHIYKSKIINELFNTSGEEALIKLSLTRTELSSSAYMTRMFDVKYMASQLMLYLALIKWIFGDAHTFLSYTVGYSFPLPFGPGPWRCVNKICPSFKKDRSAIVSCKRYVHEYITGEFCCPECGMRYTRRSKPGEIEDEEKFSVESFGHLWMDQVIALDAKGITYDQIAAQVYSSDVSVRKHLKLYNQEIENKNKKLSRYTSEIHEKTLKDRKSNILASIQQLGSNASRPDIRKHATASVYDWVMKHDRDWMESALPARKLNMSKVRNYFDIDREISKRLIIKIEKLKSSNIRRITKNLIVNQMEQLERNRLNNQKHSLVVSWQLIDSAVESEQQHLKRIFPLVVEKFQNSRYSVLTLSLIKTVLCQAYYKCSRDIDEWIELQLSYISKTKS